LIKDKLNKRGNWRFIDIKNWKAANKRMKQRNRNLEACSGDNKTKIKAQYDEGNDQANFEYEEEYEYLNDEEAKYK
jgi:hypothetical protein